MNDGPAKAPDDPARSTDAAAWIGRRIERSDVIAPRLAQAFAAALAPHLAPQNGAPLGVAWCLAPDIVEPADLGEDGHSRPGVFLPALPYPRRMWAGGELTFHGGFAVGDVVTKTSTIEDIAFKTGASGRLAFVTVRHHYRVGDRLVLGERQDIVYREAAGTGSRPPHPPKPPPAAAPVGAWTVAIDPVMMFRYSALTFNGHRIHYDRPYATAVEGYAGLVIHGPLQATLMLNLAAEVLGEAPARFAYRGQSPLIAGAPVRVEATGREGNRLMLHVLSADGVATMVAEAEAAERAP